MSRINQAFIFYSLTLLIICSDISSVLAQRKLSPHFTSRKITNKDALSVCVKDTLYFKKTYGARLSINKIHQPTQCVFITIRDTSVVNILRQDPNVLFIDTKRVPHAEGNFDLVNPAINRINMVRNAYPDLNGGWNNISIKEDGFDKNDIDLMGRSFETDVTPSVTSQHATTMAVLIGGAGNSSPQALGVAKHTLFTASDFNNLMPDDDIIFTSNGILAQNHSYGVGIENYYGAEAQAYDQQVYSNPSLTHVFSSGNIGTVTPTDGTYVNLPFANLTGTFKQAKNVLVVSAIDTSLQVNTQNSKGPAYDGRLKPELTAYGPAGTSEAAALTTGMISLLQERFMAKNLFPPELSRLKAVLIASADDIGSGGIDYKTGFGNINAFNALHIIEQDQIFSPNLSENDQTSLPITVGSGVAQLKVAVCWIDPPAAVNSNKALVNDIDSWIEDGASVYKPWVLSSFPHADSLTATAKRKEDHLNNTEFITIDNPPSGIYQVVLKSGNLSGPSQSVFVAYHLKPAETFSWAYPVASDIVQGATKNLLLWDEQTNDTGDLYAQINSGDWQLIKEQLNLDTRYKWNTPDTLAKARLKMIINGVEFLSEEFIISPQLELNTAFNCADSLGLYWNKINNATSYEVFALGNQYLEPIKSTTDTLVVFSKPAPTYFAVVPMLNQAMGIKSGSINYIVQGASCYLNFFSADRTSASDIEIKLSLSSFYNVDHVNILKTLSGVESILATISSDELNYSILDLISAGGIYTYQAQIVFTDGSTLLSDRIELIIESPGKVVIWPNPVTQDDYLNIVSDGNAIFRIITQLGEIIYEENLSNLKTELDIESLPDGLYFYQLLNGKTITDTGRIIKL